jgi:hypothetical protein
VPENEQRDLVAQQEHRRGFLYLDVLMGLNSTLRINQSFVIVERGFQVPEGAQVILGERSRLTIGRQVKYFTVPGVVSSNSLFLLSNHSFLTVYGRYNLNGTLAVQGAFHISATQCQLVRAVFAGRCIHSYWAIRPVWWRARARLGCLCSWRWSDCSCSTWVPMLLALVRLFVFSSFSL